MSANRKHRTSWSKELRLLFQWLTIQISRVYDEPGRRLESLHKLAEVAATFSSREVFLTAMALQPQENADDAPYNADDPEGVVILSTIHSAKGHEWSSVTIINAIEGCMPFHRATSGPDGIEEERRLLYVAMTRAKHSLRIIVPRYRFTHQNAQTHQRAKQTQFIPRAISNLFDLVMLDNASPQGRGHS